MKSLADIKAEVSAKSTAIKTVAVTRKRKVPRVEPVTAPTLDTAAAVLPIILVVRVPLLDILDIRCLKEG